MENLTDKIRLKEVQLLVELVKTSSLREVSRKTGASPGQISKAIKSLENRLGLRLFIRSAKGIEPTAEAEDLLPYFEQMQELHQRMRGELKKGEPKEDLLGVASTSFLSTHLLPQSLANYQNEVDRVRFRLIDLPPSQFVPVGMRSGFQICVHIDELDWPRTWTSVEVGQITWDLYSRVGHPVGKRPGLERVLKYPFVYPVYWSDQGIRFGDDGCPVNIRRRVRGNETATATAAAEVVRHTDHLGFLPGLVMKPLVSQKLVHRIGIPSWKPVKRSVYLTVKNDLKQSAFLRLKDVLIANLAERRPNRG